MAIKPEKIIPKLKKIAPGPMPKVLTIFFRILYPGLKDMARKSPVSPMIIELIPNINPGNLSKNLLIYKFNLSMDN
jgi:hypothetical protein